MHDLVARADATRTAEIAAAVRRERERLAEALHDDALQRVLLARQELVAAGGGDAATLREDVRCLLDELASSLRSTTQAMHEATLDELPLAVALERLAADAARRGRLVVTTSVAPEATGANDRVVRTVSGELLANAVGHAGASHVEIEVTRAETAVVLRVRDDGVGLDPAALDRAGRTGPRGHARLLRTMAAIGGTVTIDAAPGAGTAVTCRMPVAALRTHRHLEDALGRDDAGAGRPVAACAEADTEAAARILARLEALRALRARGPEPAGAQGVLADVARLVSEELGWTVVVNRHRPSHDDLVVVAAHGLAPGHWEVVGGATYTTAEWAPLLAPRFARRGVYFIPDGALRPACSAVSSDERAWRDGDDLLVPFSASDGRLLGVLSLDAPRSGRRPTEPELDVLATVAGHVGLAVEQAAVAPDGAVGSLEGLLRVAAELTTARDPEAITARVATALREVLGFDRVIVEAAGADGLLRPVAGDPVTLEPLSAAEAEHMLAPSRSDGPLLLAGEPGREALPASRRGLLELPPGPVDPTGWHERLLVVALRRPEGGVSGLIWLDRPRDGRLPDTATLGVLGAFAAQAAAAQAEAQVRAQVARLSGHDELTQLGNRRAFGLELGREVARAARTGLASVLILCVVEGCPELEDDALPMDALAQPAWREASAAFDEELRRVDRAFRIQGALFAFLLAGSGRAPETTAVTVRIAARLRAIARRQGLGVRFGTAAIGPDVRSAGAVLALARRRLVDTDRTTA